jgi:transposase
VRTAAVVGVGSYGPDMARFRLLPTPEREETLLAHCRDARHVWNLALEQQKHWQPGRKAPGYVEQAAQLTEARAEYGWLRAGSQTVQQQALRDFAQAMKNFFNGTHRRPTWRKAGVHEGFRQVGFRPHHLQRLNRRFGGVWVPKVGWVRFRLSRPVPKGIKSYRVTRDRAGRWHVASAHIPDPITVTRSARGTVEQHGTRVAQKRGLNRAIMRNGWGQLVARLQHKALGRVEQIPAAYTSQRCSACGHVAPENRKSQAVFECESCNSGRCDADVNAARNIAAGRAVTARGDLTVGCSANREPQFSTPAA